VVNNLLVYAIASDSGTLVRKLIDQAKGDATQPFPSEVEAAVQLIPGAEKACFFATYNYLRVLQMVTAIMPMPIPQTAVQSQSNIAIAGKVSGGSLSVEMALPKQHLMEIMTIFMQMQQKKMPEQQERPDQDQPPETQQQQQVQPDSQTGATGLTVQKVDQDTILIKDGFLYQRQYRTSDPPVLTVTGARNGVLLMEGTSGFTLGGVNLAYSVGAKWTFEKGGITFRNGAYRYTSRYKGATIEFREDGVLLKGFDYAPDSSATPNR
jgi:hypothetical protein